MPLREVSGDELPALGPEQVRLTRVEKQCQGPERALERAVGRGGSDQQSRAERRPARQTGDRPAQGRVVPTGDDEQDDLPEAHDGVGAREQQGQAVEGLRHAQRHDQQRGHRGEDRKSNRALFGIHDARQPGVAHPRPPQHAEHEQPLRESLPGRVVRHQRGALGEREHEH
jgi:hypothetical protein